MNCQLFAIYQPFEPPNFFTIPILGIPIGYLLYLPNILTFLGSGSVILSYIIIPALREHPTFPYLIHLATTEFLANTFNFFIVPITTNTDWYIELAFEIQVWLITVSLLWTTFIAFNFYRLVKNRDQSIGTNGVDRKYTIIAYGVPTLLIPLIIVGLYEKGSEWFILSQFFIMYILLWVCIIINTVMYLRAARYLKRVMGTVSLRRTFLEFFWYPLILLGCWMLNTIAYVMIMVVSKGCISGEENVPLSSELQILVFLGTFTARLQGFFNGVAYLSTRSVWKLVKERLSRHNRPMSLLDM